jgi:DNA modification methylase
LDVIERALALWSLPGETVLSPFLGIGSEVYAAVEMGRMGVGIELKPSYFKQAVKNIAKAGKGVVERNLLEPAE